ncbi:MAG TPA: hypothetical protein VNC39_14770 [Acidocella sp.]|uniref:hypothetical protein n=1 Tax=Acidocella sp. TaxID=50710 RepID=UPI002B9FC53A|nr:hypothetical protein [Acidocella sp.]HVE23232.1 hypothetical protein [Acidocella sp.]
MTMGSFAKILSWRAPGNFPLFIALAITTGLSGCATLSHYEQSLTPPHPEAAPPSPAALRAAETRGYQEGLQAGKRIQARHDSAVAQAARNKASSEASAMAQEAIEETQDMQTLQKVCVGAQTAAKPAATPTAIPPIPPAPKTNSPDAFAPSGPAEPLAAAPGPF